MFTAIYRNTTDLCIQTLNSSALLTSSRDFFLDYLECFVYTFRLSSLWSPEVRGPLPKFPIVLTKQVSYAASCHPCCTSLGIHSVENAEI